MISRRWPLLLVSFSTLTIAFSFGLFSLPVFYPVLSTKFGWSRAEMAAGGSIVLLLIGLLGPVIGGLTDRFSIKAVLIAGASMSIVSLALLSTAQSLAQFYAFCVLLGVATAGVSLVPTSLLIAPVFSRRGTAVGFINAGVGIGGFIAPMLVGALLDRSGAAHAFLWLALFPAIPLLLALFLIPAEPTRNRALRLSGDSTSSRGGTFWMLGLSLFFAAHALTGVQQHLILYLTGLGIKTSVARSALSVLLGASALGKLAGGFLADRYSSRFSLVSSALCLMAAICGLLSFHVDIASAYWIAAIFGLGYGGIFNAPSIVAFEYFGIREVGKSLGRLMMFFGLGTSSGGLLSGFLFDHTHTYTVSFAVDLAAASIAGLLLLLVRRRQIATADAMPGLLRLLAEPANLEPLTDLSSWATIKNLSERFGVAAFIARRARARLPTVERAWCDQTLVSQWAQHERHTGDLGWLVTLLHREGIRPLALKGPVCAHRHYDPPFLRRPSHDLDLAIRDEDLQRASSTLIEAGYKLRLSIEEAKLRSHHVELSHPTRPPVELHFRLSHGAYGIPVDGFFNRAIPHALPSGLTVLALAPADEIVQLALHFVHSSAVTFFHLYELRRIWNAATGEVRREAIHRAQQHRVVGVFKVLDVAFRACWSEPLLPAGTPIGKTWLDSRLNHKFYEVFQRRFADDGSKVPLATRLVRRWLLLQTTDCFRDAARLTWISARTGVLQFARR